MPAPVIFILNGPNLNLLGVREPKVYGHDTLESIETRCQKHAESCGMQVDFRQTNTEGTLIDWVHEANTKAEAMILNAAGYSHTSVALHDALKAVSIPKIELHISNIHARETFRHKSMVSPVVTGLICGFGTDGYVMALDAAAQLIEKSRNNN